MEAQKVERRLAAILHADVKGYSRLIGEDEPGTLRVLRSYLEKMRTLVERHGGRAVGSRGDSLLAEFPSAVEAVQCALEIQQELAVSNAELPVTRRVEFRIGINLGEIVVEGEQIHGEGINIAVRLEALAEVGSIFMSEIVYEQVKSRLPLQYKYVGERALKNIATPVRVWQVATNARPEASKGVRREYRRRNIRPWRWTVLAGLVIAGVAATMVYVFSPFRMQSMPRNEEEQAPPLPLPDKPSLVVLPFVNMSKDPDQEYFSDGLTEVLTSGLSRLSGLFVIARNSAFTYKGKAAKVQDVGREMGVRYVLEGSVQRADQRIRIAAQLIEAQSGYHMWSEEYDRPFKDILALEDEIVQKICTTLKLRLTVEEQGAIVRKGTNNLDAYDAFLRGVEYNLRTTKEANAQARQMFEKAIALDPQYAEAYAALSLTYYLEWDWRWSADPQTLERALTMAQRAIALDDSLPSGHGMLGMVYAQKQQYDQAIVESERAIALDPNNADSYGAQAEVLNFMGRSEDALRSVEKAMRLNPRAFFYLIDASWAYTMMGRHAEAIATLKTLLLHYPQPYGYPSLADNYLRQWISQLGQDPQSLEHAFEAAKRAIVVDDSLWVAHSLLGRVHLFQKHYDQALAEVERAVALDPSLADNYASLALVLSYMGRSEEALRAGEQALRRKPLFANGHLEDIGDVYAGAGRFEEAIPLLRQYLSLYPNILSARLALAAVYSELGKAAEARTEAAEVLRINPQFSLEVHKQRVPIKDPAALERHLAALRKAGLK